MKIEVQLRGVDGVVNLLNSLPAEVVSKRGGPAKTALRKGAVVIQKQEIANLRVVTANATSSGKKESTDLLAKNVIVTRGKAPSEGKGERYLVRVKRKKYLTTPDGKARTGKAITTTTENAARLEYGSRSGEQPAEPWIRPAVKAKGEEAIHTITGELLKGIDSAVKRLARP